MELTRIQRGSNIYAVYDLNGVHAQEDHVSLMMINNNQNGTIGLAPVSFEEMNGVRTKMLFDVTGRVTLREYVSRNITQEDFRQMLLHLVDTIEGFDEYMIDVSQVLLDMNAVFINAMDHSVSFLCIALEGVRRTDALFSFFKELVESSFVTAGTGEVSYFNRVYNLVHTANGFSLQNIRMAILEKPQQETADPVKHAAVPEVQRPKRVEEPETITISEKQEVEEKVDVVPMPEPENKKKGLFGGLFSSGRKKEETSSAGSGYRGGLASLKRGKEPITEQPAVPAPPSPAPAVQPAANGTSPISNGAAPIPEQPQGKQEPVREGTILLGMEPEELPQPQHPVSGATIMLAPEEKRACLIRSRDQGRVLISKPVFSIGRDAPELDYDLHENTYIGHRHANILRRDGEFYLVDLHSVNHTYLNGTLLQADMEMKLTDGDTVRFANEDFTFRIL